MFLDKLGEIIWYLMFLTPIVTVPLVWRLSREKKAYRILSGFIIALLISIVFFIVSCLILLRNGLGPT